MICWLLLCAAAVLLMLGAAFAADGSQPEPKTDVDTTREHTLYTVGYAHLDTQWRWTYQKTIRDYLRDTLDDNFALFERFPGYIFNFSGSNRYRMIKEYYPGDYEELKQYVAQGRWFPCGSSVEECDVNCTSAESIIRQVLYGNHYFRTELGQASEEFMLPDCFGFPASLPNLLAHCGLKGFSTQKLTWGSANGIPFNVGIWEGLDGTQIIAAFNPGSYGGQVKSDLSKNEDWLKRIDANGKATGIYSDYMYYGTGDFGGAPTPESVYWIEQALKGEGPLRVRSTDADQLFKDITPTAAKNLPRWKGDLMLTEHSAGSITSQAYMKRWNHQNELLADSAERAAVIANWLGARTYPQRQLNNAWTLVMGGQFHDILPGTSHPEAYEFSHNDEVLALNQFADVLQSSVAAIAAGMDTQVQGQAVVVYNPLNIERQDLVTAEVPLPSGRPAQAVVVSGPDGGAVPAQLIGPADGKAKVRFLAQVPAIGFAVYDVKIVDAAGSSDDRLKVTQDSLENAYYRIKLDANGDVVSIFDKQAGREMLSAPIRLAFTGDAPGYWPAWNIDWEDQQKPPYAYVSGPVKVRIAESGPARVALEVTRDSEGSRFITTIALSSGEAGARVEFNNIIDWRSTGCNLKAVFPLSISNPLATYNWEAGTVQRSNNDEKKYEVPAHQWFDLTDTTGEYGVTVLCPNKYGSDKPDDSTLRLTLLRTPGCGSDDYADQATQDWGRHEITFGLAGHKGAWNDAQTNWHAMRLDQPLLAFNSTQHAGKGKELQTATVSTDSVRLMAVKLAEDGDETIVRAVELNGKPAEGVTITLASGFSAAREVDGQERPLGEAAVKDGALVADFKPYQIRTFAVRLAAPAAKLKPLECLPMSLPYNASVANKDDEIALSGFDGGKLCLAAEMLPAQLESAGVVFMLAPAGANQQNAVKCNGQTLALPQGSFNRIYLLGAACGGDQDVEFQVDGQPVKLKIQDWGSYVGLWDTRTWKNGAPELAFEWPYPITGLNPGFVKRAPVAWFCSHRHNASGQNLIYSYSYLYRYAIDIPVGAKMLQLPVNEAVTFLALTAADDSSTPALNPAQPLYDTLEDHAGLELALKK